METDWCGEFYGLDSAFLHEKQQKESPLSVFLWVAIYIQMFHI